MALFLAMVFSLVILVFVTDIGDPDTSRFFTLLLFALFYVPILFLHVYVHELGHVIFGRLSGYSFKGASVSGLWVLMTNEGLKVRYFPIKGAGGATISVPRDGYKEDTPYAMMIMGGVFMNAFVTILFAVIAVIDVSAAVSFFSWIAVIVGVYTVLVSLIPMSSWLVTNDAALLRLFRKEETSKHCMYFLQIRAFETVSGIRNETPVPDDLPYGNRLADAVRLTVAEMRIEQRRFSDAEHILRDMRDNTEEDGFMYNMANFRLLFIHMVNGADRGTIDAIYDEKMRKFVSSLIRMDVHAILFLVAYEKRFSTGAVKINDLVKRFNKMIKKIRTDTSLERGFMDSLLSDAFCSPDDHMDRNSDESA
jgi:hypothetical protein